MIVDGRAIARDIYRELENTITHMDVAPHLTVFTCAPNFETRKFLALKRGKAFAVGIGVNVIEFPEDVTTADVIQSVVHAQTHTDGIIVQLPFPLHIDTNEVLKHIPRGLDVDVTHYDGSVTDILPPVTGAIKEIAEKHDVLFAAAKVVIVGNGRLVGKPTTLWAQGLGAQVQVITEESTDNKEVIKNAQILILGAGKPGLVTADMVRDGVLIFDAGASEEGGELKGDADATCSEKASLFTPVPGGIGPITIAVLLRNLMYLR